MNCKKCEEMLSDFLDDTLDHSNRLSLGLHLRECDPCYTMRIELAAIIILGRELRREQAPLPNANALWARLVQSLDSHPRGSLTIH
jgi:Putative zinc-finger